MKYFDRTVHVNPNQAPMKAALARTVIFDIPLIGMSSLRSTSYAAGGISHALLDFFLLSYWDVVAALDITCSRGD